MMPRLTPGSAGTQISQAHHKQRGHDKATAQIAQIGTVKDEAARSKWVSIRRLCARLRRAGSYGPLAGLPS